ncbi:MAG TPA: hypothetical protein VF808_05780 [Ktedonobacterales bacterium]
MVILLAKYKVRPDADREALSRLWNRMHEIVTSDPGYEYLGSRLYSDQDGSSMILYEFGSLEGLNRFASEPEHLATQRRGAEFFEWMTNDVCVLERRDVWSPGGLKTPERLE